MPAHQGHSTVSRTAGDTLVREHSQLFNPLYFDILRNAW